MTIGKLFCPLLNEMVQVLEVEFGSRIFYNWNDSRVIPRLKTLEFFVVTKVAESSITPAKTTYEPEGSRPCVELAVCEADTM